MKQYKTPMMKQYTKIKEQYSECILFFRLGDFYEMFLKDAEIGSKIMGLTLTARNKGTDGKIPMCGIPYHAIDRYLPKLVNAGYSVAICEQIGEVGKGIVDRDVVRIISKGTLTDEKLLDEKTNNYILTFESTFKKNTNLTIAYADLSTGQFYTKLIPLSDNPINTFQNALAQAEPKEIILRDDYYNDYAILNNTKITDDINITRYSCFKEYIKKQKDVAKVIKSICDFFDVKTIEVLQIDHNNYDLLNAIGHLISYFNYTQKKKVNHFKKIQNLTNSIFMEMDINTINNLELFESNKIGTRKTKSLSLFNVIDKTKTPMGARLLKQLLLFPSIKKSEIDNRLNSVEELIQNNKVRTNITEYLKQVSDIQRLSSKIALENANARDILDLKSSLVASLNILNLIKNNEKINWIIDSNSTKKLIETISYLCTQIRDTLKPEPPILTKTGKMIKDGVNQELDDLKASIFDSQQWIAKLENIERVKTGIKKLKVGFNSIFGYYIEISKIHIDKIPPEYIRKQTLVNSERYITEELKFKEEIVLNAQDKINELEYKIFISLVSKINEYSKFIQKVSDIIAKIDYLQSFATKAIESNYIKPHIQKIQNFNIEIIEGRHPVVEETLETGKFTPNETHLTKDSMCHLITGPNMAGKSTYIRQVAIIQLLAQIGSYIPAYSGKISIVDAIYTRIGAGDALAQGLSTFMVEMIETAKILRNATKNSLIILDEVGRGTGTLDGLSIARAVVEYIVNTIGGKTLFATHFHELIKLENELKGFTNFHIEINDNKKELKFLHKLKKGGTDKSYGLEVAKMAGIPKEVIAKAQKLINKNTKTQLTLGL